MSGDYFYTISTRELSAAIEGYGYADQSALGYVDFVQSPGTVPLFRLRDPASGVHSYTLLDSEREEAIAQRGLQDEGVACFVHAQLQPGDVPVFRCQDPDGGAQFYTSSPAERDQLLSQPGAGFVDQGIAFYAPETNIPNTVPLFRLRQPAGVPALPRRIRGFADLHNHQFAHLAFGGLAFAGAPFGPIEQALPHCDPVNVHGPGGTLDLLGDIRNIVDGVAGVGHLVGGYPEFDGWPRWNNLTHQAVYQDWLKRALDGGLKLIVMLAVNSEIVANVANRAPGRTSDDMEAVDLQIKSAYQMQDYIDRQSGGPGKGWYRIVTSPQQAREVIEAGKLAVVLGIEVDNIFGSKAEKPLSPLQILTVLDTYYEMGVRHIFPIHFDDNAFGGTGFQNILIGDPTVEEAFNPYDASTAFTSLLGITGWPSEITTRAASSEGYAYRGGRVNAFGLTNLGKFLINALMNKGMIIDTDHMSGAAWADTLTLAEEARYPTVSSHTGFIDIGLKDRRHEGNMRCDQAERIHHNGGMIACILNQGNLDETPTWRGIHQTVVEHNCGDSSETWAQAYLYATEKAQGAPTGFGTDFNGMIHPPGPRFGSDGCHGGRILGSGPGTHNLVRYPFTAVATGKKLKRSAAGSKTFDINVDGLAHIGLLPDFIADLQQIGLTEADLDPLLSSAEGYIQMWEQAERRRPPIRQISLTGGPWWVQAGGGFLKTREKDLINFAIEPGAVDSGSVEFVLELYGNLAWRKELQLLTDHGILTLGVHRDQRADCFSLSRLQLPGTRLSFRKDKGPDELITIMEPILDLDGVEYLPAGSRVTFRWVRDK